ncbi:hypothetical protein PLUTE_a3289 [Pseudoalteromonas luteoviolacea DSM 6061]|nr:hypothetical protein [Pseudoalteromonas luteoviolacea DSM 6061]
MIHDGDGGHDLLHESYLANAHAEFKFGCYLNDYAKLMRLIKQVLPTN